MMTITQLVHRLSSVGIDTNKYGTGKAKTLEHLLKELNTGECGLEEQDGKLVRTLSVLGINVYHTALSGIQYRLVEREQVFKDGRRRSRALPSSLGEKLKPDEKPGEASVKRAIQEELRLTDDVQIIKPEDSESAESKISGSYPGLETIYKVYRYVVQVGDSQYKQDGYSEEQEDKTTFFKWVPVIIDRRLS